MFVLKAFPDDRDDLFPRQDLISAGEDERRVRDAFQHVFRDAEFLRVQHKADLLHPRFQGAKAGFRRFLLCHFLGTDPPDLLREAREFRKAERENAIS